MRDVSLMLNLLENLGFIVNMEKSILFPSQELEFLGVLVSSIHMSFSLPESKVLNLRNDCRRLLNSRTASQSDLARLIGKMIAAKAAIFQAPLHYRALQHQKSSLDHQGVPPPSEANSRHRSYVRPGIVGSQPGHHQLQTSEASPSRPANPVGCFRVGLGGCVQQHQDKGNLVSSRILTSHKLLGAACSHLRNQGLHQILEQCPCPDTNGQHIGYSLCKQNGGSQAGCVR